MADSTTPNLNLSRESIRVAAEDTGEVQITNQAAAEDGSLTHITFMDRTLYLAAADGDNHALEEEARKYDILVKLTPKKNTVLHVAAEFGQADCVKCILRLGSPSSLLQQPNEIGDTPLHLAAREGHLTVVQNLIAAPKDLREGDAERGAAAYCKEMLRMTNKETDTALHEAVRYHHPEVVKLLIQEDPDYTYAPNTEGNTPLYIAAEWGSGDLVQMILDNCTSPGHSGIKGRTALHAAVILNDQAMTKQILEWKPALTKELDEKGWSPLHFAAYVGCDPTIVRQLLEKSEKYVVYLGVKDHGNRTALHIAASRGHVDIVKVLVSDFPDCCEKVDNEGNNVLHLIMPKSVIFLTSELPNIRRLRVRGLMNEKNVEGKTPLHLFHDSALFSHDNFPFPVAVLNRIFDPLVRSLRVKFLQFPRQSRSSRIRIRPVGSLEIKEDGDSSESKEREEISEIKKAMKTPMLIATLIATVTFAAAFTLPGGYIQNESNNHGMAVLSLPTNGTEGKDRHMAIEARKDFKAFVVADTIAMGLSISAIIIYFMASLPVKNKTWVLACLGYGHVLTLGALVAMVGGFSLGLEAVLHHSPLEGTAIFILLVPDLVIGVPILLINLASALESAILDRRKVKFYTI